MIVFKTEELRNEKCSIKSLSSWLPNTKKLPAIN